MDISDETPLPVDLESAIIEIRILRNMLFRERQKLAALVHKIEADRRSRKNNKDGVP